MTKILILSQIISTLIMFGVIWIIQLVQYPLLSHLYHENFPKYHAAHTFWITPVVAPTMIAELITSILIIFYPANINVLILYIGLVLTLTTWVSTLFIQIPLHNKLANGFEKKTHQLLVKTNWIRTIAWSLRSIIVIYFAWSNIDI